MSLRSRSFPHSLLLLLFIFQPGSDVQSARSTATRIPMSKGMKPSSKVVLGVSTVTRLESRAESQSMKIELRRPTVCSSASAAGGKSWGLNNLLLPNIRYRPHQYAYTNGTLCAMSPLSLPKPAVCIHTCFQEIFHVKFKGRFLRVFVNFYFAPVCFSWSLSLHVSSALECISINFIMALSGSSSRLVLII